MKILPLFLISCLALTGCGASDGDSANDDPVYFDITPYREASAALTTQSLTGTWVGVVNIESKRRNMVNADVKERVARSRLEAFVLRSGAEGKLELSYCDGGFESITLTATELTSEHRILSRKSNRYMTYESSGSRRVILPGGYASYIEDVTFDVEFYRVSDSTDAIGTITKNWSDESGESSADIFCATVENYPEDLQVVTASSDDNDTVFMVSEYVTYAPVAVVGDATHAEDNTLVNIPGLGDQSFSFSQYGPDEWLYDFSITNSSGLTVTGQVALDLLPE